MQKILGFNNVLTIGAKPTLELNFKMINNVKLTMYKITNMQDFRMLILGRL